MTTQVKNIAWWTPSLSGNEEHFIKKVLNSNYLNDGDVTSEFENEIAKLSGVKYAVAVTSGTSALFLALASVGVGHGDEVIVPDVTFIASANAVSLTGARPVLVDIDPLTLNIDPAAVLKAITKKTKAIMPVHVSGRGADMKALLKIAKENGLFIIEDAAEALMSKKDGQYLGAIGDAGCFSFSPNKTITTGQGGMVVTNNSKIYNRLKELKDQGRRTKGTGGNDTHYAIGYNFKFTNLQSAVGLAQLTDLHRRFEKQKQIYNIYKSQLGKVEAVHLLPFDIENGEIPQWSDAVIEKRDELNDYLQKNNIHCRCFWYPIHTQSPYFQSDDLYRNSTNLMKKAIWLPSAFTLSDDDILTVCEFIKKFFSK